MLALAPADNDSGAIRELEPAPWRKLAPIIIRKPAYLRSGLPHPESLYTGSWRLKAARHLLGLVLRMFKKPTVLIIGAGASAECGMPTGAVLKEKIARGLTLRFEMWKQISGDAEFLEILRKIYQKSEIDNHTRAANELARVIPSFISIDEALHYFSARPDVVQLGKLATAFFVLKAEHESSLRPDKNTGMPTFNDQFWLWHFLSMALSSIRAESIDTIFQNITIINFNYDRVVEHYLYWALRLKANVDAEMAARAVGGLRILRPYGSLGSLEWQSQTGLPFGADTPNNILDVAARIRTYTEQHDQKDLQKEISAALAVASLVIVLGFGFHQQNMTLLKMPPETRRMSRIILATVFDIHEANFGLLESSLDAISGHERPRLMSVEAFRLLSSLRPLIMAAVSPN